MVLELAESSSSTATTSVPNWDAPSGKSPSKRKREGHVSQFAVAKRCSRGTQCPLPVFVLIAWEHIRSILCLAYLESQK